MKMVEIKSLATDTSNKVRLLHLRSSRYIIESYIKFQRKNKTINLHVSIAILLPRPTRRENFPFFPIERFSTNSELTKSSVVRLAKTYLVPFVCRKSIKRFNDYGSEPIINRE